MKYSLLATGLYVLMLASVSVAAQDPVSDRMREDAQSMRDSIEQQQDEMRDAGLPSSGSDAPSQQADPTVKKFDKDGNPNYDVNGNYIGCNGLGCRVDNPDGNGDDAGRGSRTSSTTTTDTSNSRSSSS